MAVSELGWSSLAEAQSYFDNERYETALWEVAAMTADLRNRALNMAYNRIYYHPDYSVPEAGSETAAQKVKLIKIQSEMAYYFLIHLEDEDRRKNIQAQGVTKAGIAEETYDKEMLKEVPIPAVVAAMLEEEGFTTDRVFGMADLERDEDESVDEDVTD